MRRTIYLWLALWCIGLYSASAALAAPAASQPSLQMSIGPAGNISLQLSGKSVATGNWTATSARWQSPTNGQVAIGPLASAHAVQADPSHAVIDQTYSNATCQTRLHLDGQDLRISMHLQNTDRTRSIPSLAFTGLTFHFSSNATGTLASWHESYLAAKGTTIFHPSSLQPIGVVWAQDAQFGFSVFSQSEFDQQCLVNAHWQRDNIIPAQCTVDFYTTRTVPPGQSVDVDVSFRVTTDCSIPNLLGDYKRIYAQHFPRLLYKPDARPVGQFSAVGQNLVTPSDPLGFGGGFAGNRRLDSPLGVALYVRAMGALLHRADALGIIFWSPGGYDPPMYPPAFDVFPQAVQRNIPELTAGLHRQGLRAGLCARCGDGVLREPGKEPVLYRLSAANAEQMKTLLGRFDHAMQMGFDMFYLDSFGAQDPNDQEILKMIRDRVGPDVMMYSEFCTDMSLPYCGRYCEWNGSELMWTSSSQYAALRYLCPDSVWLCKSRTRQPDPPIFARMGLTPIVEDSFCNRLPASQPTH